MNMLKLFPSLFLLIFSTMAKEKLELPKSNNIQYYKGFSLEYSEEYEQPLWVAYELTKKEVHGTLSRSDNFKPDPTIKTGSADLADYKGSGYDRGHLAPAADMKWDKTAMDESFYMSNMSPQKPEFNRGIWKDLESLVRKWATDDEALLIATGPIFSSRPKRIGKNRVAVPKAYYKVIIDYRKPVQKGIAFIIPHEGSSQSLKMFATSIDEVERKTGIDFFHNLPDSDERALEKEPELSRWEWVPRKSFVKSSSSSNKKSYSTTSSKKKYKKKSTKKSKSKKSKKKKSFGEKLVDDVMKDLLK